MTQKGGETNTEDVTQKDGWLRARAPKRYEEAAKDIGRGDLSIGLRESVKEAAERRGIPLDDTKTRKKEHSQVEGILSAIDLGGAKILKSIERFSSTASMIAKEKGMTEWKAEEHLKILEAHGLVMELDTGYRASTLGKYMIAVLDTLEHDIPVIQKNGERGAMELTIYHAKLGERLTGKRADIKEVVDRTCKSVELLKRNTETLLRILS